MDFTPHPPHQRDSWATGSGIPSPKPDVCSLHWETSRYFAWQKKLHLQNLQKICKNICCPAKCEIFSTLQDAKYIALQKKTLRPPWRKQTPTNQQISVQVCSIFCHVMDAIWCHLASFSIQRDIVMVLMVFQCPCHGHGRCVLADAFWCFFERVSRISC